jgi:hypothetical protein
VIDGLIGDSAYRSKDDPHPAHVSEQTDAEFIRRNERDRSDIEADLPEPDDRRPVGAGFHGSPACAGFAPADARLSVELLLLRPADR